MTRIPTCQLASQQLDPFKRRITRDAPHFSTVLECSPLQAFSEVWQLLVTRAPLELSWLKHKIKQRRYKSTPTQALQSWQNPHWNVYEVNTGGQESVLAHPMKGVNFETNFLISASPHILTEEPLRGDKPYRMTEYTEQSLIPCLMKSLRWSGYFCGFHSRG